MPTDDKRQNKVATSVRSAFGVDPNLQDESDSGPSFFQRVLDALKGSDSLGSKITESLKRKPGGSK